VAKKAAKPAKPAKVSAPKKVSKPVKAVAAKKPAPKAAPKKPVAKPAAKPVKKAAPKAAPKVVAKKPAAPVKAAAKAKAPVKTAPKAAPKKPTSPAKATPVAKPKAPAPKVVAKPIPAPKPAAKVPVAKAPAAKAPKSAPAPKAVPAPKKPEPVREKAADKSKPKVELAKGPFFQEVVVGSPSVRKVRQVQAPVVVARKQPKGEESHDELIARIEKELLTVRMAGKKVQREQVCTKCCINPVDPSFMVDRDTGYCTECAIVLGLGHTREARQQNFHPSLMKSDDEDGAE
jgi:hypothetical protein